MSRAHLRYLLIDYGAIPVVFNTLLNAGIAWALFATLEIVPLWGSQSIAGDTLFTCFLLPCIACLIVTPLVRGDVRRGGQSRLTTPGGAGSRLAGWTPSARRRSLIAGTIGLLLAAPATLGVLVACGVTAFDLKTFILFKGLFAGGLAAAVVPLLAAAALRDGPPR